ncbi:hypothetical protein Scep_004971 [Stephania cephalantha]|uniref:Transmembrane protein n=1 Tax=Stephania cephalantha TaxID=152367 RepID=A0AAP0KTE9_9MAGN
MRGAKGHLANLFGFTNQTKPLLRFFTVLVFISFDQPLTLSSLLVVSLSHLSVTVSLYLSTGRQRRRRTEAIDIEGSRISVQGNPRNERARTRITNLRWFD